ncbi:autotransporter-associated beta strand repeat-containing protein, partial [Desulfovibrio sp. OttesenSCG-928-A18]|nr:autotransporter-associated beta strand repeat-containing protein [Desulfovibrio sp. OttesenSCG-928-A18]
LSPLTRQTFLNANALLSLLLAFALVFAPVFPALAVEIVTTNADAGSGSLREAITTINTDGVPNQSISFAIVDPQRPNTISLTSVLPTIGINGLTIDGSNGSPDTAQRVVLNGDDLYGIFALANGVGTLDLKNLTLRNSSGTQGAIYAPNHQTPLTLALDGVTFSNNSSTPINHSYDPLVATSSLSITTSSGGAIFSGNSGEYSGAIYSGGTDLSIGGNILFENNRGSTSGAIYSNGNLTLDTGTTGDIYFIGNEDSSGPNAIKIHKGQLTLKGGKRIVFDDPIQFNSESESSVSLKSFATLVQFDQHSILSGATGEAGSGEVMVSGGEFRVLEDAIFDTGGTATSASFTLPATIYNNAHPILSGAGTISTPGTIRLEGRNSGGRGIISPSGLYYTPDSTDLTKERNDYGSEIGTLTLSGKTVLFDGAEFKVDLAAGNVSDKISVVGSMIKTGQVTLITPRTFRNGEYTILEWDDTSDGSDVASNKFIPHLPSNVGARGGQATLEVIQLERKMVLKMEARPITDLIWKGDDTDFTWVDGDTTMENWDSSVVGRNTFFLNGDTVFFTEATASLFVLTHADGVQVDGMTVSTGGHYFSGGKISGTTLLLDAPDLSTTTFSCEIYFAGGITVNKGNTLVFRYGTAATIAGDISGEGDISTTGANVLTLPGKHTYTGDTHITTKAGLTVTGRLGSSGGIGDYSGDISNAGTLTFDQSADQTLRGVISGTGSLAKDGKGKLTLTGDNTYTGKTSIYTGAHLTVTGRLDSSGGIGDYSGDISNAGTLTFDQTTDQTLRGRISGPGSVRKQGNGILTVNGTITSDFTLAEGVLAGTGTLQNVTLNDGTSVSPGGSGGIGSLNMGKTGGITAFYGVTYVLDTGANDASDQIIVAGSADLKGGKIDLVAWENGDYTVLSADGITGNIEPAAITLNGTGLGPRHAAELSYGDKHMRLVLSPVGPLNLTWTGLGGKDWNWGDATNLVWKNSNRNASYFMDGDSVTFDSTSLIKAVTVADTDVNPETMTVSADGYSFTGGAISGKKLTLAAPAASSTTFANDLDFSTGITVNAGNTLAFNYTTNVINANAITGAGNLLKQGGGSLTLSGDISLGGTVAVDAGTLLLDKSGLRCFSNALFGAGVLAFDLGGGDNPLNFTAAVGDAFTGVIQLKRASLELDEIAARTLSGATLQLDRDAGAALNADRIIKDLTFNGGNLSVFTNSHLTVKTLSVTAGGGTITVDDATLSGIVVSTKDRSLYDYADPDSTLYQKRIVTAATISQNGSLTLTDVTNKMLILDVSNNADIVGKATYNLTASILNGGTQPSTRKANENARLLTAAAFQAPAQEYGIYLGYGLTELEALPDKIMVLDSSDSTATSPAIFAKLTGQGGFTFSGSRDAEIGNWNSDYSGATLVSGDHTITLLTDNAFGNTSSLSLEQSGKIDMNGMAQTVPELRGKAGTSLALGHLTVNQNVNTTFEGVLTDSPGLPGQGLLTKKGYGTLTLASANTYSGGTVLEAGTLALLSPAAAGTSPVAVGQDATLQLAFSGAFSNDVSGQGVLNATAGQGETISLSGNNTYTGMTTVISGGLKLESDLASSKDLTLYGGTAFITNGHSHSLKGGSLTVWSGAATYDGDLKAGNATLNFVATDTAVSGPMLLTTGTADIDGGKVNLGVFGAAHIASGATLTLLEAAKGISGSVTQGDGSGVLNVGATVVHDITLSTTGYTLSATVDQGRASSQAKALSEGYLGGVILTLQGADLAAGAGLDAATSAIRTSRKSGVSQYGNAALNGGYHLTGFGTVSGGRVTYDTGSHIDMDSVSLITGLAVGTDLTPGRLNLGLFFEYGTGSYDTHNSFSRAPSVDGDGHAHYFGGGLLGRMDFTDTGHGHPYLEATGRAGKVHTSYDSSDLRDAVGRKADYDTLSWYYSLHVGAGYIWEITDTTSLDVYAKYFWTRQEGDSIHLSTGEQVRFKSVDSHRTRIGGRFSYTVEDYISPYIGAAWEHEFDGKTRGATNGHSIEAPDLEGHTGIVELGVSVRPSAALPLSFDLGAQGYTG